MKISREARFVLEKDIKKGLESLKKPEPLSLSKWAEKHFYLSAESSYVEGKWEAFPFQVAIMDCISNDDIREVNFIKSARVGATKMMLAAIGYFAQHKRRNQAIWQPVDGDITEFVKTEIDTMLRDVPILRSIFPWYDKKHKNNTLEQKMFIGSTLHMRGGKAAKNYRRISPDVVYLDELDGFDHDIEKEGSPVSLAAKRIEGATFPKMVMGSTPKLKESSMIGAQAEAADMYFKFHIPCPHCDHEQPLEWGGKDAEHGFKWLDDDPESVEYLCKHCHAMFKQDDYLKAWDKGRWMTADGIYIDEYNLFHDIDDEIISAPKSIAFHIWTAYSPMTEWSQIVSEFMKAKKDPAKLKGFVNLTLGEPWEEEEGKKTDAEALYKRREYFEAEVPDAVNVLVAGIDTQDDRTEMSIWGFGEGEESWLIDHKSLFGDLSVASFWTKLANNLKQRYKKADGTIMDVKLSCIDSGGHFTSAVYDLSKKFGLRSIIPIKGSSTAGKPVATFPRKRSKDGVYLTFIGTDTAKDLLYFRTQQLEPGEGYLHFPVTDWCNQDYFAQFSAESRKKIYTKGRPTFQWVCKNGVRNEALDCAVYALAAVRILQQNFGISLDQQEVQSEPPPPQAVAQQQQSGFTQRKNWF